MKGCNFIKKEVQLTQFEISEFKEIIADGKVN